MKRAAFLIVPLLTLALLAACRDETQSPPAPSTAASQTPLPGDVAFEPLTVTDAEATKLLFIRGSPDVGEPGSLWMSNLDGSGQTPLIEEAVVSAVIGVARHWQTGNATVYYVQAPLTESSTPAIARVRLTVSALDLATGGRADLLAFEIEGNQVEAASDVTGDGRLIAYTDVRGLAIFDTSTGQTRRVLDSDTSDACDPPGQALPECSTFLRPSWSPDGSLLAMNQVFYEGGKVLVVDVNADPPRVTAVEYDGIYPFEWSPSGTTLCAVSPGDFYPVGLIVTRAPDWRPDAFLTDYQSALLRTPAMPNSSPGDEGMWGCVWLDETTVAVMHDVFIEPNRRPKEVLVLDSQTGQVTAIREHNEFTSSRSLVAVPGREMFISQFRHTRQYKDNIGDATVAEAVDARTGARAAILAPGDWVVAVLPPDPPASVIPSNPP